MTATYWLSVLLKSIFNQFYIVEFQTRRQTFNESFNVDFIKSSNFSLGCIFSFYLINRAVRLQWTTRHQVCVEECEIFQLKTIMFIASLIWFKWLTELKVEQHSSFQY